MPVRNAAPFLKESMESIQNQTFTDWELLIINDHSTDKSEQIIADFARLDRRIQLLQNQGKGIIPALQTAFSQTKGLWITRMDADDCMPTNRLSIMLKKAEESPPLSVTTGLVAYFSSSEISPGYRTYEAWLNTINLSGTQWLNIYRECVIASPNWLISKKILLEMGGFSSLQYPEDYHLVLKWYQLGLHIQVVPEVTLHWREHPLRTSRLSDLYGQAAFFDLKIEAFLSHDWNHKELIVWGKNEKTRFTEKVLREHHVQHRVFELSEYEQTELYPEFQLLIGVYPEPKQRTEIIQYLEAIGRKEGQNFWFL